MARISPPQGGGVSGRSDMLNVLDYGADPTGALSSTAAFLAALKASILPAGGGPGLYVPHGTYMFNTTLDLTQLGTGADIQNWQWICNSGAIFQAGPLLGANTMINLAPPAGFQFNQCKVVLPQLIGIAGVNAIGIQMNQFSDGFLDIMQIHTFGSIGFYVDCAGNTFPTGNNQIRIGLIATNGTGFATNGNPIASSVQFSGNQITIGDVIANVDGINIDLTGTGNNTQFNIFNIGVVELSSGKGIIDSNGLNRWIIGNTGSNGNPAGSGPSYFLTGGSGFIPYLRGFFTDTSTIVLNGQIADVINTKTKPGSVAAPAMPASGTALANPFDRPASVYISGGTVTAIDIGGSATGITAGVVHLLPGETVAIVYSIAPTWTWFLV